MCTVCVQIVLFTICLVKYPDLTGFLQCIQIVIFISILEKIVQKEKKKISTSIMFSLDLSMWGKFKAHFILFFIHSCDTLFVGIFGYYSMDVCVNLWKLYYANCYLNFFLEKITSINENIFSFFYKRCQCQAFSHFA